MVRPPYNLDRGGRVCYKSTPSLIKNRPLSARLKNKIATGFEIIQQYGLLWFCREVLPWLFCRRYFFYSQVIRPISPLSSCASPIAFKLAKEEDLPSLLVFRRDVYNLSQMKKRLREGHLCFIGWLGERPVHVRWIFVRFHYAPYLHRSLLLSPGEAYVDETFTAPDLRNKGIATFTGHLLRLALLELGFKRYSCAVASWNKAQQRVAEKFGMEKVGEGGYFNFVIGKKFIWRGKVRDCGHGRIQLCSSD